MCHVRFSHNPSQQNQKEVAVELKNDVELTGKLHSVDQYLNVKLEDVQVVKKERYPQLVRRAEHLAA